MQKRTTSITLVLFLSLIGCKSSLSTSENKKSNHNLEFSIQLGTNSGGIVENTDLETEPGTSVDAFSGATKTGFNAGVRVAVPVRKNAIQTGMDFMYNHQTFTYNDTENGFSGVRELALSQFMLPLTWNFGLLNHPQRNRQIEFKLGPVLQYNLLTTKDDTHTLPAFAYNKISAGVSLGIAAFPFAFKNNSKLGVSLEVYRGSRIYEDYYNQSHFKMPGSSYARFALIYHFQE